MAGTADTNPGKGYIIPELPEKRNPEWWSQLTDEQRQAFMNIWSLASGLGVVAAMRKGEEAWNELYEKFGINP